MSGGWGLGPWGLAPWGTGIVDPLRITNAVAIRDNTVRLTFNVAPLFSGILDDGDASDSERYAVVPVVGTIGADGLAPRAVTPCLIEQAPVVGSLGKYLDVTVDRPFSPYSGQYLVSANGIRSITGMLLDPTYASFTFYGLSRGLPVQRQDAVLSSRDIANTQDRSGTLGSIPTPSSELVLGTIGVDSQGDLAFDNGMVGYRKRVLRRCLTRKGGFSHLPEYGVGVPDAVKQLGKSGTRESLAAEAESQIQQEPETKSVQCQFVRDENAVGLYWLKIKATTIFSTEVISLDVPFLAIG